MTLSETFFHSSWWFANFVCEAHSTTHRSLCIVPTILTDWIQNVNVVTNFSKIPNISWICKYLL